MTHSPIFVSARYRPATRPVPTAPSRRPAGLAVLLDLIATWRQRTRIRKAFEQISKANPHLIDDIGLTKRQVEAEIAKRFWQD